jgi:hypothetical protein
MPFDEEESAAMARVVTAVQLINAQMIETTQLLRPYTRFRRYPRYGPRGIGMHATKADELAAALEAIHRNFIELNKMLSDIVPKLLGNAAESAAE